MKRVTMCWMIMTGAMNAYTQTGAEWTQQKKTQLKYLVNQVAALQAYIDLGQKGYAIYRDGLSLIGDSKDGEFSLHKNYFGSLSAVNPHISHSPKVAEILSMNEAIQLFRKRIDQMELRVYAPSIRKLFAVLARKSADHVAQLNQLIADGRYQLTDAGRTRQITQQYQQMSTLYSFARSTYEDAGLQRKVLTKQEKEMESIERWEGWK